MRLNHKLCARGRGMKRRECTLRVHVLHIHILTQNMYYTCYLDPMYPVIGHVDP